jgi:hypothetical protein
MPNESSRRRVVAVKKHLAQPNQKIVAFAKGKPLIHRLCNVAK